MGIAMPSIGFRLAMAGEGCFFDDRKKKKKILELQLF